MDQPMPHPETATLTRSITVQRLIQRVFAETCNCLSRLNGRTVEQFCKDEKDVPRYVVKYFTPDEKQLISSKKGLDYDIKLSYKLFKTCCGLAHPRHEIWSSSKEQNTFEYLITFCWNEYDQNLRDSSAMADDNLNDHMDKILEALVLLLEKLEKTKKLDFKILKSELRDHIGKRLESYDNGSCSRHMYTILCEHAVHQMLVMVYKHLNHLNGVSLSKFLNFRKINLVPRTGFSNERKFLEGNPPPEKMPVRILYQVVKHVCFNFELRRTTPRSDLEATLHDLKEEYMSPPRNEEEYTEKCYKVYELLANAFQSLCKKTNKEMKLLIGNLARETFVVKSLQKPFGLPDPSPSKKDESPRDSSTCFFTPCSAVTKPIAKKGELTVEEVNVCLLFKVMARGGLISDTLALVFKALKGNFNTAKKNWKYFTSDEKDFIRNLDENSNSIHQELCKKDITFLCKILRYGVDKLSKQDSVWLINNPVTDMMEYNITFIRKERNKMAHGMPTITTEDLNNTLDKIKNSLHIIMEKTKCFLEDDEHDIKKDIRKQQDNIEDEMQKNSRISHTLSLNNMWAELLDMSDKVKKAAQEELNQPHIYGENLLSLSPITGSSDSHLKSLTIDAVFMDRKLEDKNDVKAENTYRIEDILFSEKSELGSFRVFIIHGRPGDGKTSICKYIFHRWSNNIHESTLKGVELLFYIPCRYVTVKSLSAYVKGKLPKAFGSTKNDDVLPLLQEAQVVFVIDGYDEAGEEAKNLIDEILTSLPDSKIIITTKTQWTHKLIDKVKFNYKVLSLVQITEEERQQFVKKFFLAMNHNEDCNDFLSYLDEMKENLDSIIHVPLTFSLLALLWIEEPGKAKKITTLPQLYSKLIGLILERVAKQLGVSDSFLCREWMITLGELAWNNLKKKKYYLTEQDQIALKKRARNLDLDLKVNNQLMSSLLHCEFLDSLMTDDKKTWTFTFTSQQEFFAAEHIVDKLKFDKNASSLRDILELSKEVDENYKKKVQRLIPVIEMICELLVIVDGITDRIKELTDVMSVTEPCFFIAIEKMFKHLMEEHSQVQNVVNTMFKDVKMSTFDNYDPQNTLWVLKNTSLDVHKEVTLISNICDVPQMMSLLDFLLSKSCLLKVIVEINKVNNISDLARLSEEERYKDVRFFFTFWKPLCISEVIMNWPFSTPLFLSLCPEVFPLVWWELLMCLLSMDRKVAKISCRPTNQKWFKLIKEGANQLKAEVVKDNFLAPTEVVIHV